MASGRRGPEGAAAGWAFPSLATAVFLLLALALVGTWATTLYVLDRDDRAAEEWRVRREMDGTRTALARRVRAAEEEVRQEAILLAGLPQLQEAVARRDPDGVSVALLASGGAPGWDMILATDYLGRFLEGNGPIPGPRALLSSRAVEAAVAGEPGDTFWVLDGVLHHVRLMPVRSGPRVVGALAVGRAFDEVFLNALRGRHAAGVSLEAGRRLFARTSGAPEGTRDGVLQPVGQIEGGDSVRLRVHPPQRVGGEGSSIPWRSLTAAAGLWLLASLALGLTLVRSWRSSLRAMARAVRRLAAGTQDTPLPASGFREERELGRALEEMRTAVQTRLEELEGRGRELQASLGMARELEREAQERLHRLRADLAEAERYARIGRMASEMAHEISTPVATLNAAVNGMHNGLVELLICLHRLETLPAGDGERAVLLAALEGAARATSDRALGPDDEVALGRELREAGVGDWDLAAQILARGRLGRRSRRLLPLLHGDHAPAVLAVLESFSRLQVHLHSGLKASHVVSRLSRSLRSRGLEKADRNRLLDVRQGLEDALTLLEHEMRGRIQVDRKIPDLPPIRGDQGELCQVWTNLIHNAVQAMCQRGGTLSVEARPDGEWVTVQVSDTGPGIAPHIRDRIFDPHFSTKPRGEGAGVGLAIARRIVEGHGGRISVDSTPGGTRFEVRLPAAEMAREETA